MLFSSFSQVFPLFFLSSSEEKNEYFFFFFCFTFSNFAAANHLRKMRKIGRTRGQVIDLLFWKGKGFGSQSERCFSRKSRKPSSNCSKWIPQKVIRVTHRRSQEIIENHSVELTGWFFTFSLFYFSRFPISRNTLRGLLWPAYQLRVMMASKVTFCL